VAELRIGKGPRQGMEGDAANTADCATAGHRPVGLSALRIVAALRSRSDERAKPRADFGDPIRRKNTFEDEVTAAIDSSHHDANVSPLRQGDSCSDVVGMGSFSSPNNRLN